MVSNTEKKDIHVIGHGHIDPTWLWRWMEGYEEVRSTFRSAVERMEETNDFIFTAGSACFYQWIKESEPELFEKIKIRVEEGRWEIVGGMWVEPDCNIPCGESLVRHGLYSQRFFKEEFNRYATVGFCPDSFGHAGTLPQLLKKTGMKYYVYMRPEPVFEMDYAKGTVFWWTSKDGSKVLAANIPLGYCATGKAVTEKIETLKKYPYLVTGQKQILCFFGVGNHGGGPTKESIAIIKKLQEKKSESIFFSTLYDFFKAFQQEVKEEDIPIIREELQHHARGCYSAHHYIKRLNRKVEHVLMNAERLAAMAWLAGILEYPHKSLEKWWKHLLYNQFHDIIAGTSLQSTYQDTRDQLGAARHEANVLTNSVIQSMARKMDTSAEGNSIIVINSFPWPIVASVIAPPVVQRTLQTPVHIVDQQENCIPSQTIRGERIGHSRTSFIASLPAMGFGVFHVRSGKRSVKSLPPLRHGDAFLENQWWRLEFDPFTGQITRLFDNNKKLEILKRGHILAAHADNSDTWSHGVAEYRVEAGRFSHARLSLVEYGDVFAAMRIVSEYDKSQAISEYTLYRELDCIECSMRINWQQQYQTLKLGFKTNIVNGTAAYDAPYGYVERPMNGEEEPGQQWVDITGTLQGTPYGFSILNDGIYGFDALDGEMRMTLLRSPAYAHHDNGRFDCDACWPIMDQGWHEMKFVLAPHAGDWRDACIVRRAWELNAPPLLHVESAHPGEKILHKGMLHTKADHVVTSVVKCSEEGEDIIIRGYETAGRQSNVSLHFPCFEKTFDLTFAPHEIKTIRINRVSWSCHEVNMLEESFLP